MLLLKSLFYEILDCNKENVVVVGMELNDKLHKHKWKSNEKLVISFTFDSRHYI